MQQCDAVVCHRTSGQQGGAEGVTDGMQDAVRVRVIEHQCLTGPVHQHPYMLGSLNQVESHVAPGVAEGEVALVVRQHPGAVVVAQPCPISRPLTIHTGITHTNLRGRRRRMRRKKKIKKKRKEEEEEDNVE